ncbi:MAG: hypothetical protein K8I30_15640, partial [Anaerolineae bacterium]|nr:hypothetical protein [Anaerolineae bacterium]
PSISADGRYVAFISAASNLVPNDTNGKSDVFLYDMVGHTLVMLSKNAGGQQANNHVAWTTISADGSVVAFSSSATNLIAGDINAYQDAYIALRPTMPPALPAPTNVTPVSQGGGNYQLTWTDNATDETGYLLESKAGVGWWYPVATLPAGSNSYNLSGLACSLQYTYRVTAYRLPDAYAPAPATVITEPACGTLPAPTNITIEALSPTQVRLTWTDNATDESGYRIQSSGGVLTFATLPQNTTSHILNVGCGDHLIYRVTAYRWPNIQAPGTPEVSITMPACGSLPAPTNITIQALSPTQVQLTWTDNATDESGYRIQSSGGAITFATLPADTTSHILNVNCGDHLIYRVTAYRTSDGMTAPGSPEVSITMPACASLPAPTNITIQAVTPTLVKLTWKDNATDEDGYYIQSSGGAITFADLPANTTSHTLEVNCKDQLIYRVTAYRSDGAYGIGAVEVSITMPACVPPLAPSGLTGDIITLNQINLTWLDNASTETDYRVERSLDGVIWLELAALPANSTAFASTGLTCGKTYRYRVRTYQADDNLFSAYSPLVSVNLLCAPTAPSGLNATAVSASQIKLNWTDALNETVYRIERSPDGISWVLVASPAANATTYTDTGLLCETPYYYRLRAFGTTASGYSAYTPSVNRTTATCPPIAAPSMQSPAASASLNSGTVPLTWGSVMEASRYEVEVSASTQFTIVLHTQSGLLTTSTPPVLADGLYYWRVRAYNSALIPTPGPWSSTRSFTVDTTPPSGTVNLTSPLAGTTLTTTKP